MKKIIRFALPLLLCVLMMSLVSCTGGVERPATTTTQNPTVRQQLTEVIMEAIEASHPKASNSTVTLKIAEDLSLVSTFEVKGQLCSYTIQRLASYEVGSTANSPIETVSGTKSASDNIEEGVSLGQIFLDLDFFENYSVKETAASITLTAAVKDDCVADMFGYQVEGEDISISISVLNDKNQINSITVEYTTPHGDVTISTVYVY